MYFLFDFKPSLSISILIEFLISKKIVKNKISKRIIFELSKYLKFISDSLMKLLSINVRNVKKPIDKVITNNKII